MFSKIRNRLTVQYTVIMALFLLAFIVVSYSGLLWLLYSEEQQDISAFAEEEARTHVERLRKGEYQAVDTGETDDSPGNRIIYFVFDNKGNLAATEPPSNKMRSHIDTIIANWDVPDGVGKIKRFHLDNGERVIIIMCSMPVSDGPEILGKVYVGKEITSYFEMLKLMLITLAVIAIIFICGAAYIGYLLADKAIIPIRQSFDRQREFAADASHELRTPLSILLTSVDAVQTDDGNKLTSFTHQTLADMKSEIRRISKIVSDLLTLARADAGVTNIVKEKFDLNLVLNQISRSFQPLADSKNIRLELDVADNLLVFADRERINQLLLILIDNAIKYTPANGAVTISATKDTGKKSGVSIAVVDTGIGIPVENRERIFERFYRIDKARLREEGGTGLGLSIAKWIAEAHGGTIRMESSPGNGSTFIVLLP